LSEEQSSRRGVPPTRHQGKRLISTTRLLVSQLCPPSTACCPANLDAAFAVNGSAIPDVDFDIGESYAGLLPVSDVANDTSKLYFWYYPSENPEACDEILIWLNGGVGLSSFIPDTSADR